MSAGFILALVSILLSWGRSGSGLLVYTAACLWMIASSGTGWLNCASMVVLLVCNGLVWAGLRSFSQSDKPAGIYHAGIIGKRDSYLRNILPVMALLLLEFVMAFSGASLGLGPLLGIGLVLAGLCVLACGGLLAQFQGMFMAADGLAVLACLLSSRALLMIVIVLWGVLALLGFFLLPRLAGRKVDDHGRNGEIMFHDTDLPDLSSKPSVSEGAPFMEQASPDSEP